MAKLSPEELAAGLGVAPPAKTEPINRAGAALAKVQELDAKLDKMALSDRQPGESEAAAHARFHRDNPGAYTAYKKEKHRILSEHGMSADAATGGL